MKKKYSEKNIGLLSLLLVLIITLSINFAFPFAYIFAGLTTTTGDVISADIVTHPMGYDGTGGELIITVGINPTSTNASEMPISVQNVIKVYNNLIGQNSNLVFNSPPPNNNEVDFESVLLHEMGHTLGLAHCNIANESELASILQDYTKSLVGDNGIYDLDAGEDGIIGSADDVRGDDININYFKIADNNPFSISETIDLTTYSRDLANLPNGDLFSVNGDRSVANSLFLDGTEAVMQQGTFSGEQQRALGFDDLAGIKYAMAGFDEIEGTNDDYTITLEYAGITDTADILIQFDDDQTDLAFAQVVGDIFTNEHAVVTTGDIFFGTNVVDWYFNDVTLHDENNLSEVLGLSIYPNPSANVVTIANPNMLKLELINIFDINGRLIKSHPINKDTSNYKTNINISELDTGVYIFEIKSNNGTEIKRIIKK